MLIYLTISAGRGWPTCPGLTWLSGLTRRSGLIWRSCLFLNILSLNAAPTKALPRWCFHIQNSLPGSHLTIYISSVFHYLAQNRRLLLVLCFITCLTIADYYLFCVSLQSTNTICYVFHYLVHNRRLLFVQFFITWLQLNVSISYIHYLAHKRWSLYLL